MLYHKDSVYPLPQVLFPLTPSTTPSFSFFLSFLSPILVLHSPPLFPFSTLPRSLLASNNYLSSPCCVLEILSGSKMCPEGTNRQGRNGPRGHHVLRPLTKQCHTHCHLTHSLNSMRKVLQRLFPFSEIGNGNRGSEVTCVPKV